jgi:hypothetical protein
LVAKLIQLFGLLDAKKLFEAGKAAAFVRGEPADVGADTAASRAGRSRVKKQAAGAEVE